jgi:hypothetical protein
MVESSCSASRGDHRYIIGEKLRSYSPEGKATLSRHGRYTDIAATMRVEEVRVSGVEAGRVAPTSASVPCPCLSLVDS